jgi:hypothetical protein
MGRKNRRRWERRLQNKRFTHYIRQGGLIIVPAWVVPAVLFYLLTH